MATCMSLLLLIEKSKTRLGHTGARENDVLTLLERPVYMEGGCPGYPSYSGRADFSHVFLENALKRLHARQGSPHTRGTLHFA